MKIAVLVQCILSLVCTVEAASPPVMLSPVAALGTDLGTYDQTVELVKIIDHSGVATPFVSGVTLFDTYFADPFKVFATSGTGGTNNWQSLVVFTQPLQGYVDLDLGTSYTIHKMGIFNRSVEGLTIKVREELGGAEQVAGTYTLASRLTSPFSFIPEVLTFAAPVQGRYVRLAINSAYPIAQGFTFAYAIIGEVIFSVTPIDLTPVIGIALDPDGNVVISFTGKLYSAKLVDGPYTEVPGAPDETYTIPKANLTGQEFFRALSN